MNFPHLSESFFEIVIQNMSSMVELESATSLQNVYENQTHRLYVNILVVSIENNVILYLFICRNTYICHKKFILILIIGILIVVIVTVPIVLVQMKNANNNLTTAATTTTTKSTEEKELGKE